MSEFSWATIHIGGKISKRFGLPFLQEVIKKQGEVMEEMHDGSTDAADMNEKHPFIEIQGMVEKGEFELIEDFCKEKCIPYDRQSAAYYEFMAGDVKYRPGMIPAVSCELCDTAGREVITMAEIRGLINRMPDDADNDEAFVFLKDEIFKATAHLGIPELEPVEFVE